MDSQLKVPTGARSESPIILTAISAAAGRGWNGETTVEEATNLLQQMPRYGSAIDVERIAEALHTPTVARTIGLHIPGLRRARTLREVMALGKVHVAQYASAMTVNLASRRSLWSDRFIWTPSHARWDRTLLVSHGLVPAAVFRAVSRTAQFDGAMLRLPPAAKGYLDRRWQEKWTGGFELRYNVANENSGEVRVPERIMDAPISDGTAHGQTCREIGWDFMKMVNLGCCEDCLDCCVSCRAKLALVTASWERYRAFSRARWIDDGLELPRVNRERVVSECIGRADRDRDAVEASAKQLYDGVASEVVPMLAELWSLAGLDRRQVGLCIERHPNYVPELRKAFSGGFAVF